MNCRCIRSTLRSLFLTGLLLVTLPFLAPGGLQALPCAQARETPHRSLPASEIPVVAVADLPVQARDVLRRIEQGGPFEGYKDGIIFGNYERLLPSKPRGYYREYTVPTPGARNRGARRIVCGGAKHHPEVCYYTHDHYASFRRIAP
ncbi:MAG: ribonuclease domain-containing protein [Thiomonas sp.]|uniref:ribonuclease domain-containing protein n=1 Tax=Thiomonas sp. TaxID=2047785 RepID=UPI002A370FCF|nr:ribonuclease domain-containing protein [Thiomonas sp.]MDY0330583.1 ribonuclease domain-containing protein [Thiomonas sp.]